MAVDGTKLLSGTRVLELATGMAGELAGLVLAQYGAAVVKVERPGGSRSRRWDGFRLWNAGKRSVTLDLGAAAGAARLAGLVRAADVAVVALRPDAVARLGLGYDRLAAWNPRIIYCGIGGFEPGCRYGGLPGYDGLLAAKTGRGGVFEDQAARPGPGFPAIPVGAYGAAQGALQGILAALRRRDSTGAGCHLQTSIQRGLAVFDSFDWLEPQFPERIHGWLMRDQQGRRMRVGGLASLVAATRDGRWIQFANLADHLFYRFMRCLGLEDLYLQPGYETLPNVAPEAFLRTRDLILERVRTRDYAEWAAIFDADGNVGYELIRRPEEVSEHPQMVHNGHFQHARDGSLRLAPLWTVDGRRPDLLDGCPDPGEADADLSAGRLWRTDTAPAAAAADARGAAAGARGGLLDGVVVVELGGYLAGPLAGRVLADLGARVIKVEPPTGDPLRAHRGGLLSTQPLLGKESISLDLKSPFGRDVLGRLIERADVLYHNYRAHVADALGFSPAEALRRNPRLVYAYAGAYGSSGPKATRPSYDPLPAALTGVAARQGGYCLPPPPEETVRVPPEELTDLARRIGLTSWSVVDHAAALSAATAMVYGLLYRQRTGRGCFLETTMLGAAIYANSEAFDRRMPVLEQVRCDALGLSPLYRYYRVSDGWVFLACLREEAWQTLAGRYLDDDLAGRYNLDAAWTSHEVNERLEAAFAPRTAAELEAECLAAGIPLLAALPTRAEVLHQPWAAESGLLSPVTDNVLGAYVYYGGRLIEAGPSRPFRRGAPAVGEHSAAILRELGYPEAAIEEAFQSRSVYAAVPA